MRDVHSGRRGRGGNYSRTELGEWADRLGRWRQRHKVYAYFNKRRGWDNRGVSHTDLVVARRGFEAAPRAEIGTIQGLLDADVKVTEPAHCADPGDALTAAGV